MSFIYTSNAPGKQQLVFESFSNTVNTKFDFNIFLFSFSCKSVVFNRDEDYFLE